ncbi:MAG: hypothetical protein NC820_06755, partial [Candidatus Omnitrophica bacterium]|nr:hypothetical protein [Candidatus Omnitrophota bacterium]
NNYPSYQEGAPPTSSSSLSTKKAPGTPSLTNEEEKELRELFEELNRDGKTQIIKYSNQKTLLEEVITLLREFLGIDDKDYDKRKNIWNTLKRNELASPPLLW